MNDRQPSERAIFESALEKGLGPERDAFLDATCAGDAELRAGVEALLAAHERLGAAGRPPEQRPASAPAR